VNVQEFNNQFNYAAIANGWNRCMYRCRTSACTSPKVMMYNYGTSVFYLLSVRYLGDE